MTFKKRELSKLQEALQTHTKMGDPKKLSSSIRNTTFLTNIALHPVVSTKVRIAEKQALNENAIINGVPTIAGSRPFGCLRLLKDLCIQLCSMNELLIEPQMVYENIVFRMSRMTAGTDAYMKLKKIIRSSNLSLMRCEVDPNVVQEAICVDVFESDGDLLAVISIVCTFGVIQNAQLSSSKADLTTIGFVTNGRGTGGGVKPWIHFDVVVTERINISTGDSVRFARVVM